MGSERLPLPGNSASGQRYPLTPPSSALKTHALEGRALGEALVRWADSLVDVYVEGDVRDAFRECYKKQMMYDPIKSRPPPGTEKKMVIYGPHEGPEEFDVVCYNNGEETRNVCRRGNYVVCGPKGEQYVVNDFDSRYEKKTVDPDGMIKYRPIDAPRYGLVITPGILCELGASRRAIDARTNDDLGVCEIKTSWGWSKAVAGSVLIREKKGAYYIVDSTTFRNTYEPCPWFR